MDNKKIEISIYALEAGWGSNLVVRDIYEFSAKSIKLSPAEDSLYAEFDGNVHIWKRAKTEDDFPLEITYTQFLEETIGQTSKILTELDDEDKGKRLKAGDFFEVILDRDYSINIL